MTDPDAELVSTLAVPVPAAAEIIPAARASRGPPRITVLFPFVCPERIDGRLEREIERIARMAAPFEFALARVDRFPGVLYLAPAPSEPFGRELPLRAQATELALLVRDPGAGWSTRTVFALGGG
jgi:2'-5' RNA ligase